MLAVPQLSGTVTEPLDPVDMQRVPRPILLVSIREQLLIILMQYEQM